VVCRELSLLNASQWFVIRSCKVCRPITDGVNTDLNLDIIIIIIIIIMSQFLLRKIKNPQMRRLA